MSQKLFKNLGLAFLLVLSLSLPIKLLADADPNTPNGLPCTNGPDYRAQMKGSFAVRFDRIGQDTRYSPGFDAAWHAQCLNPSGSGAVQKLLDMLNSDITDGVITKSGCELGLSLDNNGNIKLCSDEADSYIGVSGGNWVWNYYNPNGGDSGSSFPAHQSPTIPTEGLLTFGQLITAIFNWSLSILGIVVFVMIFYAGFQWFTAAGNTAKVNEAKDRITNAILGAILLLSAYLILYTINPDLVGGVFKLPGLGQ